MRNNFVEVLIAKAKNDPSLILITGDLGFGVFEKFEELFPEQYFNLGIAEQGMSGIASGLALSGKNVVIYSIGNFPTLRCLEQIRNDMAYHDCNVTIVSVGAGFSYGQLGMSHHATEDLAIMRALPNVEVLVPATLEEASLITSKVLYSKKTSYLRLDKSYGEEYPEAEPFEYGKVRSFTQGEEIVIISTGGILSEALETQKYFLEKESLFIKVLSCHMIKPFDEKGILDKTQNAQLIITLEEHNLSGGLGSLVSEVLFRNKRSVKRFISLGLKDIYSSVVGDQKYLRSEYKMDKVEIINQIKQIINN